MTTSESLPLREVTSVGESLLARTVRLPAVWLAGLVGLSALVRGGIGIHVPTAWILPDEIVYSELAKSIAAGHRPAVRGVPVFGWGEVYPTLIAPAWALIDDPVHAYHAALAISALVMSFAAVPAYLLARMFVSRGASFVVAAMTVLVPSMAYTGVLMTENAFYPVFLLALLLIARAVRRPTTGRQVLAIVGLALVAFTRIQGLALVGAYLVAVLLYGSTGSPSERPGYLRRFVPTALLLVGATLAPVVASLERGDGPFGWLGSRSNTFASFHAREVPEWLVYLASDLVLYVAVIPAAATAVMVARGLRRGAPERVRLFAALALPAFAAMLGSVALVSASLDVDGTENLNERYVFYAVPLLFVGLALWIREGMPRSRSWDVPVVASLAVVAAVVPVDRLEHNAGFQSVGLLPWIALSLPPPALALTIGAFGLACGGLWLVCRRERSGRLWLAVGVWMALAGALAVGSNAHSATKSAVAFDGRARTWIDDALPPGATVAAVWDENDASPNGPDPFYAWLMATELFSQDLGSVYRIGPPTYYETFLPTVPARVAPDGTIVLPRGSRLAASYVLVSCRTRVRGSVVAEAPRGAFRLVATHGTPRISTGLGCERRRP